MFENKKHVCLEQFKAFTNLRLQLCFSLPAMLIILYGAWVVLLFNPRIPKLMIVIIFILRKGKQNNWLKYMLWNKYAFFMLSTPL